MFNHNSGFDPAPPSPPVSPAKEQQPSQRHTPLRLLFALALSTGIVGGALAGASAALLLTSNAAPAALSNTPLARNDQPSATNSPSPGSSAGAIYTEVGPSVVEVVVSGTTPRGRVTPTGSGSGVVIDEQGYILTNNHVVSGATS